MKTFNVDCELKLHYGIEVEAKDEEQALEKAEKQLEKIVLFQRDRPKDYEFDFGDVEEIEL